MIAREKQLKILELYNAGKTIEEIAKIVKLAPNSVRTFLYVYSKQVDKDIQPSIDKQYSQLDTCQVEQHKQYIDNIVGQYNQANSIETQSKQEPNNIVQQDSQASIEVEQLKQEIDNLKAQIEAQKEIFSQQIKTIYEQLTEQVNQGINKVMEQLQSIHQVNNTSTSIPEPTSQEEEVRIPHTSLGQPIIQQNQPTNLTSINQRLAILEHPVVERILEAFLSRIGQPRQQEDPVDILVRKVQEVEMIKKLVKDMFTSETSSSEPTETLASFINTWIKFLASLKKAGIQAEKIIPNLVELTRLTESLPESPTTKPVEKQTTDIE